MSGKRAKLERKGLINNNNSSSQKEAGKCIFCGRQGDLSKQHIWPKWMEKLVDSNYSRTVQTTFGSQFNKIPYFETKKINGDPGSQKLRKVCVSCNSGWINNIVEANMRPVFTKLIQNPSAILNEDEQKAFSVWAVLSTMVNEFTDEKTVAVPKTDRLLLCNNKTIPPNWQIWIEKKDNSLELNHYSRHRAGSLVNPANNIIHNQHNCQCTLLIIKNLVIFTVRTPDFVESFEFNEDIHHKMIQVHPMISREIIWEENELIGYTEILTLVNRFSQFYNKYVNF